MHVEFHNLTRVVATAVTYMRRVYSRKSMTEYDPRLVAPACLYLASKAEESTVQARLLVFYIKKLYADDKYRYEIKDILEMEMKILEALNYYLVVFHPYRSLSGLLQDAGLNDLSMTQLTWGLVNDTYKMDLMLVHPPHQIALACIYIASVLREKDTTVWYEELRVDMNVRNHEGKKQGMDSQQIEEPHTIARNIVTKGRGRKPHRKGKNGAASSSSGREESLKEEERLLPLNKTIMPGRWETNPPTPDPMCIVIQTGLQRSRDRAITRGDLQSSQHGWEHICNKMHVSGVTFLLWTICST
ncbi:cyclin-c1-2-like protein [Trifolium pratense]|uniref:B-like cyclin n=3 Tax=Trifolium TaxID=3898 RepID=A0A2K3NXH3_TRIPR|nr:cyclin-c1-2-like protein [Trifolium pratense]